MTFLEKPAVKIFKIYGFVLVEEGIQNNILHLHQRVCDHWKYYYNIIIIKENQVWFGQTMELSSHGFLLHMINSHRDSITWV